MLPLVSILVKTRLHNLYLLKFFHLYERTFAVLTLLKSFEKNLTRQPFDAFETWFIHGDHFISFTSTPGGGFCVVTERDQRSIFRVLNFENLYFFWLLNKSCILKRFILSKVFFNSPGASIIMGLHYYRLMLEFREMNSVFEGIF